MACEGKSIEALSIVFTLGIAMGTLLFPPHSTTPGSLLLPLVALPVLLKGPILNLPERQATGIILLTYMLLGMFCASMADIPAAEFSSPIEDLAAKAVSRLRAFIGSLPFSNADTAPLLKALLTGDRSGLSAQTVAVFRGSGASHLLALSGLHIGIIYLIFDKLTWIVGRSGPARAIRFGLIVSGALFFTLMTGAGPSIVRAFLFILINETLRLLNRPRKAVRVLCLALFIQLVLDPSAIKSVGFQLSYLAMAGIFLLYPLLESWYPGGKSFNPLRRIWQAAALSISCQVFTAPLAWYRFHSFPRFFLITNLLAIPLTTALIGVAVCTLALSSIGLCPPLLLQATDLLSTLLQTTLTIISTL